MLLMRYGENIAEPDTSSLNCSLDGIAFFGFQQLMESVIQRERDRRALARWRNYDFCRFCAHLHALMRSNFSFRLAGLPQTCGGTP